MNKNKQGDSHMKTITFAGSNSSKSINQILINYAASQIDSAEIIHLTDYTIPMYSMDIEEDKGIPEAVKKLDAKLATADHFIISVCEHNGNMSAFFKNIMDWLSRHNNKFMDNKTITLFSTSPGKGGGASALAAAQKMLPYFGAQIIATASLPSFYQNYSHEGFNAESQTLIKGALTE